MEIFNLKSFEKSTLPYQLSSKVNRTSDDNLGLIFTLKGDISSFIIPPLKKEQERCDRLWERTCFECFLGNTHKDEYLEFNFSPSGDWNFFYFFNYRDGKLEYPLDTPKMTQKNTPNLMTLEINLSLDKFPYNFDLINISAILIDKNKKNYFSIKHPIKGPDFHQKSTWVNF